MSETLGDPSQTPAIHPASDQPRPASVLLEDLHRRLGANFAPFRGRSLPADYGQASEEYRALRETCGLLDRSWISLVEVTGEDRVRFLNGLITCEIKDLEPGCGTFGFITSLKGRIMADLTVLAFEDRLWLELPSIAQDEVLEHCQKYVIIDRVEFLPRPDFVPLTLIGPGAAEVLGELAPLPEQDAQHVAGVLLGADVQLVKEPNLGPPCWTLWLESTNAEAVFEGLMQHNAGAVRSVGHNAFDRLRVEQGQPLFGRDYDAANFPQESGFEHAVSYTKGCYLGQEVVARIHYRGGVNRRICGLRLQAEGQIEEGAAILHEGREAGRLSSVVESASHGGVIALAMLHKRAASSGTVVEFENGETAEVVDLPFGSARK